MVRDKKKGGHPLAPRPDGLVMTVAAAEVAVGLAIVVSIFRLKETTDVDEISLMKWNEDRQGIGGI